MKPLWKDLTLFNGYVRLILFNVSMLQYSYVRGCYSAKPQLSTCGLVQAFPKLNLLSLFETKDMSTPLCLTISLTYISANPSMEYVICTGRKCTDFVSLSKISQLESCHLLALGRSHMKSLDSGISKALLYKLHYISC